jgi:hypothetical protein
VEGVGAAHLAETDCVEMTTLMSTHHKSEWLMPNAQSSFPDATASHAPCGVIHQWCCAATLPAQSR